jgi:hypothetical protein
VVISAFLLLIVYIISHILSIGKIVPLPAVVRSEVSAAGGPAPADTEIKARYGAAIRRMWLGSVSRFFDSRSSGAADFGYNAACGRNG